MLYRKPAPKRLSTPEPPIGRTINTFVTLEIWPLPGVSIASQLEPAVRAIKSDCGNFVWSSSSQHSNTLDDGSSIDVLHIKLIHNDRNHDGNVSSGTIVAFEKKGLYADSDDDYDVMSPKKICEAVGRLDDLVKSVELVQFYQVRTYSIHPNLRTSTLRLRGITEALKILIKYGLTNFLPKKAELLELSCKGDEFPNRMGNKGKFPNPWDKPKNTKKRPRITVKRKKKHAAEATSNKGN